MCWPIQKAANVHYVEQLIGPNTVVALLPLTLESFRDHGHVHTTLPEGIKEAGHTMELIEQVGNRRYPQDRIAISIGIR